jgi:alpha-galactosidase
VYVNVDDTWEGKRDAQGILHTNERFPDMKALGDYIHSKGLKFGIYSSPGAKTCGGYAGSLDHEAQDATMYASWGIDYLKYDLCSFQDNMNKVRAEHPNDPNAARDLMIAAYRKMR